MKAVHIYVFWTLLSVFSGLVDSFVVVAGIVTAISVFGGIYTHNYHERCNSGWIRFNSKGLQSDLDSNLFGQHLASPIIFKAVSGFLSSHSSQKPLVLSLHGTTGTGKNFISTMVANNLYEKGMKSQFVHVFTATKHFPHSHLVTRYKTWLQEYIETNVANCGRSMFIFDEMDKMHPGLINVIEPYLEYRDHLGHVSYSNTIFIFLSNAGGDTIVRTALDFKNKGLDRSRIPLRDLEKSISLEVFNTNSGFFQTGLIERSLVDFFVPFLPLEFRHVVQCVLSEMRRRNLRPDLDVAEKLARDLIYIPKLEQIFCSSGCKTIEKKLPFYL